jgi:hypothetical protein
MSRKGGEDQGQAPAILEVAGCPIHYWLDGPPP